MRVENYQNYCKYNKVPSFAGIKFESFTEFMGVTPDEFVKNGHKLINKGKRIVQKNIHEVSKDEMNAMDFLYQEYQRENEEIFRAILKPEVVETAQKITDLPTYGNFILPYITGKKKSELQYLLNLAKKRDILGEMRIPGGAFSNFSVIPYERLKMLEPIILSKNDAGMWNYGPSFIWYLDNKYDNRQLEIMSKLVKYKLHGMNLCDIAENPYLNHRSIIEKAKSINELFGKNLREIAFLSKSDGQNYISIDVGLGHNKNKPDWLNFKRLYAKVGSDEIPVSQPHSTSKIDKYVHNIYQNLENKMIVYTPEQLEKSVKDVLLNVPWANETEVLRVMQKLTQFADYSCLKNLSEELASAKINKIRLNGGINYLFNYFTKIKSIINLPFQKGEKYEGIFVTKEDFADKNFINIMKYFSKFDNVCFINLEGWSDGINLFNDNNLLSEKTIKVLKKVREIMAKNSELTFNDALDYALNGKIEKFFQKHGLKYKTVSVDAPATGLTILEQMRPIMPTESLLKSTVESVANYYSITRKGFEKLAVKIAKYYDESLEIYTKQRMIENLKDLKFQINDFAKQNGIKKENIYHIVPVTKDGIKSFDIVSKMFSQILNIPKERVLRINTFNEIKDLPENSVYIIADDVIASGYSMADACHYSSNGYKISDKKHILFCPVSASTEGIKYINFVMSNIGRKSIDKVLTAKNSVRCYDKTADNFVGDKNTGFYKKVFGYEEDDFNSLGMCTSFPYMAPDNNSDLSGFLLKFFTPDKCCIKSKSPYFSDIEKDIYYYNIFGTDEKHVPTNLNRLNDTFMDKIKNVINKIFLIK